MVLNGSIYLSQLFGGAKDNTDRRNVQLKDMRVDDLPIATSSAHIVISGNISGYDTIVFYINNNKVKETQVDSSGVFSEEIGELNKGDNEIYILAKSKNDAKKSPTYRVSYQADKPKLEIKEPKDNSTTSKNEIKVVGQTDKDIEVKIDDLPVVVDSAGNFQTTVKLKDGENKIKVVATDTAGNKEEKTLTVKYEKD